MLPSSCLLLILLPLVSTQCTTCGQANVQSESIPSGISPAEMGMRLGKELAARLTLMSYPSQQTPVQTIVNKPSFSSSDISSLIANLGKVNVPQYAPQWPIPMGRPQPNQQVLIPKGNCPYCRGNKGK